MPGFKKGLTRGVLFDYGRTLVTFDYPTEELLAVLRHFRPRITSARPVKISSSVKVSTLDNASSRMRMRGSRSRARAIAVRCF